MRERVLLSELDELFHTQFDKSWFGVILDELPIDAMQVGEIRRFLALARIQRPEDFEYRRGLDALKLYIRAIRTHLLPRTKELFRISRLQPGRLVRDPDSRVIREFSAFTLPHNLDRLAWLTREIEGIVFGDRQAV